MQQYNFVTHWKIEAPVEKIWPIIKASEQWPTWWKALKKVDIIRKGNASGVGEVSQSTWRTALPYTLAFNFEVTEVIDFQRIAGRAFGELEGIGVWTFTAQDGHTAIRYDWQVHTNKGWMNWLAPLLESAFRWNHDTVMAWGEEGLRRRVGK
jgi:uncharacterized membrane protein